MRSVHNPLVSVGSRYRRRDRSPRLPASLHRALAVERRMRAVEVAIMLRGSQLCLELLEVRSWRNGRTPRHPASGSQQDTVTVRE